MWFRTGVLLVVTILLLISCGTASPVHHAGLYVDVRQKTGLVSPLVFGSNTGPWQTVGNAERVLARDAGIRMIRWPGGDYGDENDVSMQAVDDDIALCSFLGAEPMINVRLPGSTPEKAAALVRLVNMVRRYKVHYWGIGNEPDLYAQRRQMDYGVSDYIRDFKAFRTAMRAVDPSIAVIGPEISQYTGTEEDARDAHGAQWMDGFLKGVGGDIDIVSYHRYPFGHPSATPQGLLADPVHWSEAIAHLTMQVRTLTGKLRPIAITEANSDWDAPNGLEAGPDSYLNAVWWADVLGRLIRGRAAIVTQFALGSTRALGMFGDPFYSPDPFPIYQVYVLYKHFGNQLVDTSFDDDTLPLFAALRDDGSLTLLIVNHANQPRTLPITIDHFKPANHGEVWSFASDHPVQPRGTTDITKPLTVEPWSATVVTVAAAK